MTWAAFETAAERYDRWYETPRGRRAVDAERELLAWLLRPLAEARSVLDVGCGTGRSTAWLAALGLRPIGLDRSPAMLSRARDRRPGPPWLLADAQALPLGNGSVDVVAFVTTLEFLPSPERALSEATRVARRGIVALALNRWSVGALSRRIGPQARGSLLPLARDVSLPALKRAFRRAGAGRLLDLRWRSALLPSPLPAHPTPLPVGDVVGIAAELAPAGNASC